MVFGAYGQGLARNGRRCLGDQGLAPNKGRHFPGDALHRKAVGTVGRNGQFQHLIVQAQGAANGFAHSGNRLQQLVEHGDALGLAQTQFGERANHAAAGDTAQFRRFDREIHCRQG